MKSHERVTKILTVSLVVQKKAALPSEVPPLLAKQGNVNLTKQ
ncbi:conserved hypothetical protein [Alteromonas sp. 38]|nr:conserved hypothetical protein [Alteromonas sp. 154]VXB39159.1 conserved hypothetical protein [Alteromonas sp. 38]|tara:strand:- start:2056 stop:2184 length:129 start_codon:yes stop_codon:yes gene_type:complete